MPVICVDVFDHLAFDKAEFEEGDHPRDNSGKFAKTAGGGETKKKIVKGSLHDLRDKLGYKFVSKNDKGTTTYKSGNKQIDFHLVSGKWSAHENGKQIAAGSGKSSLKAQIEKMGSGTNNVEMSEPAKPEKKVTETGKSAELVKNLGFKETPSPMMGTLTYEKGDAHIIINAQGAWVISTPNEETDAYGTGEAALKKALEELNNESAKSSAYKASQSALESEGFTKLSEGDYGTAYSDNNDTDVDIQPDGSWELAHGYSSATGPDAASLKAKLAEIKGETNAAKTKPEELAVTRATPTGKVAEGAGFTKSDKDSDGEIDVYKKGDKTIEIDTTTGEWLSKVPGKLTKGGVGEKSLSALMDGKDAGGIEGISNVYLKNTLKVSPEQKNAERNVAIQDKTLKTLMMAAPKPNSSQESAIKAYTGPNYRSMNDNLRADPDHSSSHIKHLDSYLSNSSLPEDVTLYRKVKEPYASILMSVVVKGNKFVDHGFSSTSTHEKTWSGELKLIISAKKGQKGAAVKEWSSNAGENEVLLPRGQHFHVDNIDRKSKVIHVSLA